MAYWFLGLDLNLLRRILRVSHWFLGSDHNFAASKAQHPQGGPKARGICAPTPKTPASESRIPIPMPFPSPFGLSLSKPCSSSICWLFDESGAALSPRRATHFSLLRQRNLRKRKATLVPASLRFASGNLRCSVQPGSRANSPAAQTSTSPDPSGPPLLGAFTRGGVRIRIRGALTPLRGFNLLCY